MAANWFWEFLSQQTGNVLSASSLAVSILQWIATSRESKSNLTIDEYRDWLRRKDHKELLALLDQKQEADSELATLFEQLKDSVVDAVATHDRNDQERHEQLMEIWGLEHPNLKLRMVNDLKTDALPSCCRFYVDFEVVNESSSRAEIAEGYAMFLDGGKEIKAPIKRDGLKDGRLRLGSHRDSARFRVTTEAVELRGRAGRRPEFASLHIHVPQFGKMLKFVSDGGSDLRQVVEN